MIPIGPGTDLFKEVDRCQATSSSEIGAKECGGREGGSLGSDTGIGLGTIRKKHEERTLWRSVWLVARVSSSLRSGGILLAF